MFHYFLIPSVFPLQLQHSVPKLVLPHRERGTKMKTFAARLTSSRAQRREEERERQEQHEKQLELQRQKLQQQQQQKQQQEEHHRRKHAKDKKPVSCTFEVLKSVIYCDSSSVVVTKVHIVWKDLKVMRW